MAFPIAIPGAAPLLGKRYFRLVQLIGQAAVSEKEAKANRLRGKGPKRPRPATTGIIPVSSPTWWRWVKAGKAPAAVKLSQRVTAWEEDAVLAFLEQLALDVPKNPAADDFAIVSPVATPVLTKGRQLVQVPTAELLAELDRRASEPALTTKPSAAR